jgi:hypothetical protein
MKTIKESPLWYCYFVSVAVMLAVVNVVNSIILEL